MSKINDLKILYYNRALNAPEGPAIHARELLNAFYELFANVFVYPKPVKVSYAKKNVLGGKRRLVSELLKESLRLLRGLWNSYNDYCSLSQIIGQQKNIDLLVSRNFEYNIAAILIQKRYGIPAIVEVNALTYFERQKGGWDPFIPIRKIVEKYFLENVAGVYTVSEELRDIMIKEHFNIKNIAVIENGVDLKKFDKNIPVNKEIEQLSKENMVIGFVGSLKYWHGVDVLLESFAMLCEKVPNVVLVIVGDGDRKSSLRKKMLNLEIERKVHMLGKVSYSEIPSYIRGFDIAVAPYSDDGSFYFSPLKVFEYMAMAKPVVASKLGQLCTLIVNEYDGVLVEPDDAQMLFEKLFCLAKNEAYRDKLGENAYRKIAEKYRWSHAAEKIITLYAGVAEE